MKLIIDIPDNIYDAIKKVQTISSGQRSGKTLLQILVNSVENSTPLDDVKAEIEDCSFDYYFEYGEYIGENPVQHRICMTDKVLEILSKAESEDKE